MHGILNSIGKVFNAGVDFVKTINEKVIHKGVQQLSHKFFKSCKAITTSMSNGFSSIHRSVKQAFKPFLSKFSTVSGEQQPTGSENPLIDKAIGKLEGMKVKKDLLKHLQTGIDKNGNECFDINGSKEQEGHIRNALVDKAKQDGTITQETYDILKNQSLEDVLTYLEEKPDKEKLKLGLKEAFSAANFTEEEIEKFNERIENYEKSNPGDMDNKLLTFFFFVKKKKGNEEYKGCSTDKVKEQAYSDAKIEELSNRGQIQTELEELFPGK